MARMSKTKAQPARRSPGRPPRRKGTERLADRIVRLGMSTADALEIYANQGDPSHEDVDEVDQDWHAGATHIHFKDGSSLKITDCEVIAYKNRNR